MASDTTLSLVGSTTTESLAPPAEGEMGNEMTVAGWKITVDAVESKTEVDGKKASVGEELLVVRFTVVNTLPRPVSLTAEDLSLKGDDSATYRPVDTKTGLFALAPAPANGSSSSFVAATIGFRGKLFGRSPEQGTGSIVRLATSLEIEGVTGRYFFDRKAVPSSRSSHDPGVSAGLWQICEQISGLAG